MATRWRGDIGGEINLAPLLDVIFSLLFFFILATSIRKEREALTVNLPRTGEALEEIDETPRPVVVIDPDNTIRFEGRELTAPELVEALRARRPDHAENPEREVLIQIDAEADIQTFVTVSYAISEAGWRVARMETTEFAGPGEDPLAGE